MIDLEKMTGKQFSLISTNSDKRKYRVEFLGNFRSQALLVSRPEAICDDVIRVGQCFHLRINQENITYSWRTRVVRLCSEPYLCLQLVQPKKQVPTVGEREARVRVGRKEMHILLLREDGDLSVSVADISLSGARLISHVRLGDIGDVLTINLSVNHGGNSICLPCKICYVRSDLELPLPAADLMYHHGVEFMALSMENEAFLMRWGG